MLKPFSGTSAGGLGNTSGDTTTIVVCCKDVNDDGEEGIISISKKYHRHYVQSTADKYAAALLKNSGYRNLEPILNSSKTSMNRPSAVFTYDTKQAEVPVPPKKRNRQLSSGRARKTKHIADDSEEEASEIEDTASEGEEEADDSASNASESEEEAGGFAGNVSEVEEYELDDDD